MNEMNEYEKMYESFYVLENKDVSSPMLLLPAGF